jgi:hypothetical protein
MSITANQTALASDFVSTSAGAGDSGKVPKLNGSGVLDTSFMTFKGLLNSGQTTYNLATASGAQNIAHGLGVAPKLVRIKAFYNNAPTSVSAIVRSETETLYSNSTQSSTHDMFITGDGATTSSGLVGTTFRVYTSLSDYQTGTITVDATNIIITWSKSSSPTGTAYLLWEAIA